jgi:hypothetical protein
MDRGRVDLVDVIFVTNEELRRAHERMRNGEPCTYVIVGGENYLVHGWWSGEAGLPDFEIMRIACRKLERIDPAKFRAAHKKDPDIRRTADFDVVRLLPGSHLRRREGTGGTSRLPCCPSALDQPLLISRNEPLKWVENGGYVTYMTH